ncbi:ribosomal protein S18 acetylase RimI-like enzyme [Neobacillus niacini]|jgi:ribosomal protein S18 acetylase RimI-like enzyme|uniref:GNAT family N-acetyltransferase n=1 Tax=Neobacillus niacini TaxID=86668 RepID=UPI00278B0D95|nr:GNAT family N-acetyltransferase [Neobacillus niacini]MDQ1003078.1 ribosomal protein S18 acetylase RimI-like enzyme [Neobacillus niacini]
MIKLGNEAEIVIAHKLMQEAFEEYRFLEVPSSAINEPVDSLRNSFRNGSEKFILCYIDGNPLGSLRFKTKGQTLYFSRVSVPPYARGRGIAKSMLSWLEDYTKKEGIHKLQCKVRSSLTHNVLLYQSIGYTVTEEEMVTNPDKFPVSIVVMEKLLEQ